MKKNDFYKRNNVYIYIKYGFDGNKIEIRFLVAKATLEIAHHGQSMSKSVMTVCLNMTSSSLDASVYPNVLNASHASHAIFRNFSTFLPC